MNEIIQNELGITIKEGSITFENFETLKENALKTAEDIKTIEVTEESVKAVKKELAAIRKSTDALESGRKEVKKAILEPYQEFEKQVKELTGIVNEADEYVRNQVRELEENERREKEDAIFELWEKRNKQYDIPWLNFEMFIKPGYLNKTTTMKKVESEMVEWFEKVDRDVAAINTMNDSEAILVEYSYTFDVADAVGKVAMKKAQGEKVKTTVAPKSTPKETLISINETDTTTVIKLLQENKIEFEIK